MKYPSYVLVLLAALCSLPCAASEDAAHAHATPQNAASIDASDPARIVATLRGAAAIADVQGDHLELKNGLIYLNQRSYGAAPARSEIQYIITPTSRALYVDGKARSLLMK